MNIRCAVCFEVYDRIEMPGGYETTAECMGVCKECAERELPITGVKRETDED